MGDSKVPVIFAAGTAGNPWNNLAGRRLYILRILVKNH